MTTVRSRTRPALARHRPFGLVGLGYVLLMVALTIAGLVADLPGGSHPASADLGVADALLGTGTAMSPPLWLAAVFAVLLLAAVTATGRLRVAGVVLAAVEAAYLAGYGIAQLAAGRPAVFDHAHWSAAVALAILFFAVSAAVVVAAPLDLRRSA